MRLALPLALALIALPAAAQVVVTDADGTIRKGRDVVVSASGDVTVTTDAAPFTVPLASLAEVTWDARPISAATEWELHLANLNARSRDVIAGALGEAPDEDSLRLSGTDAGDIDVPINFAYALRNARSSASVSDEQPRDDALYWTRDNKHDFDKGTIRKVGKDAIEIDSTLFSGSRTYKVADVECVQFAPLPEAVAPAGVVVIVSTRHGTRVTGRIVEMTDKVCRVETTHRKKGKPWEIALHSDKIASIQVLNGNLTYLSDMNPKVVAGQNQQFLDEHEKESAGPWIQLDRMFRRPEPVTIGGKKFRKGIATLEHVEVEIDLAAGFSRFTATVGLTEDARPTTTATDPCLQFIVKGDGKELWKSEWLKFDSAPQPVALSVKGVKTLTLVVDFQPFNEWLAYGGWGDARVVK